MTTLRIPSNLWFTQWEGPTGLDVTVSETVDVKSTLIWYLLRVNENDQHFKLQAK